MESNMNPIETSVSQSPAVSVNKVLRNTYALLALSFVVSAAGASVSMAMALPPMTGLICMLVGFGMLFVVEFLFS